LVNQLDHENFDFFILDIEMSEMSGKDLAKKIRERDILSPIVFLTSYKEYKEEVFQVQTFENLLNPPTEDRLHQVLEKLRLQQ
ncbi:LytR/AlgR family response regulator transcription factor, partial [Enterococcus faecalis]|uniref:LytR/AlgR family response regulator transcription factor n=1 Tax=Enterococcus faecalis TaxID=1351 RepID=UPI003CC5C36D